MHNQFVYLNRKREKNINMRYDNPVESYDINIFSKSHHESQKPYISKLSKKLNKVKN